jgi:desulfoferrodoxin (superoxide reductase-like protein)
MTEKSFIKWLRRFLSKTDIKNVQLQNRFEPTYNHTTVLKEISDKLENIKNV